MRIIPFPVAASLVLVYGCSPAQQPLSETSVLVASGRIESAGLTGTWRSTSELATGRFAIHSNLGIYRIADIYDGRTRWKVEPSGGSHPFDTAFAKREAATEAWLAGFGWQRQGFGGATRKISTSDDPGTGVIVATPRGGNPVALWFAADGTLLRARRPTWFSHRESRYGDYRAAGDQRLPFSIVHLEGGNEDRITVARYDQSAAAAPGSFSDPGQPEDAQVPEGGTTVPVTVFPQLVVDALLNGRQFSFVFDTGGHSIVTPEAAKALGLRVVGGAQSGGSGSGTLLTQSTRVGELRIGDAIMRDQHFYVLPLSYSTMERGAKPPMGGLLGLEVLERFIGRLDYRSGTLTLLPRTASVACGGEWRPARFTGDMPTIDAIFDGRVAPFTIDTGNNGSLMLYRHWLNRNGVTARYDRGVEAVSYGAGGASRNWVSYAGSFQIGSTTAIRRPMVRTSDDKGGVALSVTEAGNLGTALLANYTLTFDYARSRICVEHVPGYQPLPFGRAGMRAVKDRPDRFLVALVNEGQPAWNAGLRKDDVVLAVDGVPANRLGGGDMTRVLAGPPGSRVRMTYRRGTNTRQTSIMLREILPR